MKNNRAKIYATNSFKELTKMHRSNHALAKRFGVYAVTMSNAMIGRPVQASFVAAVLVETGMPFESLFEVR